MLTGYGSAAITNILIPTVRGSTFNVRFLCMLQMTISRTGSIMVNKIQNGRFIAIFRILRQ